MSVHDFSCKSLVIFRMCIKYVEHFWIITGRDQELSGGKLGREFLVDQINTRGLRGRRALAPPCGNQFLDQSATDVFVSVTRCAMSSVLAERANCECVRVGFT